VIFLNNDQVPKLYLLELIRLIASVLYFWLRNIQELVVCSNPITKDMVYMDSTALL